MLLLIFKTGVVPLFRNFTKLFFKSDVRCHIRSLKCVLLSQWSPSHVSQTYLCLEPKEKKKYCFPTICSLALNWGIFSAKPDCLQLCLCLSCMPLRFPQIFQGCTLRDLSGLLLSLHPALGMHAALCALLYVLALLNPYHCKRLLLQTPHFLGFCICLLLA